MGAGKHILRNHLGHKAWLPWPAAHPHAQATSSRTPTPTPSHALLPNFFLRAASLVWLLPAFHCFSWILRSPVSCPHSSLSHHLPVVNNISALSRMLRSLIPGLRSTDFTHFQTQRTTGLSGFQDFNRLKYNTESLLCAVWGSKWIHFLLVKTEKSHLASSVRASC